MRAIRLVLVTAFWLFSLIPGYAQNSYTQDLQVLYQAVKKLPAYHDQVKGREKAAYDELYLRLQSREVGKSLIDTFTALSTLLSPLKDKHLGLWGPISSQADSLSKAPFVSVNLDSLRSVLELNPLDSVEGVYYAGKTLRAGVYRTARKDSLNCVVLESKVKGWSPGQLLGTLLQLDCCSFRMVLVDPHSANIFYARGVKVTHGRFHAGDLRKELKPTYAEFWRGEPYRFQKLGSNIDYLYLGTFSSSPQNLKVASDFAAKLRDSLTAEHLIVDIRGNAGGGDKCSRQFYSLVKERSRNGKVHVLVNSWVFSNAEQFALKLKALKNVTLYGETTDGMITYGSNYGSTVLLPSGRFKFYPTDMKDSGGYLKYEEIGVEPDVFLSSGSDWLGQVRKIIAPGQD